MSKEKERLDRIISGLKPLTRLAGNQDFMDFRAKMVEGRLEQLLRSALLPDLNTEEGKTQAISALWRYKELRDTFEVLFETAERAELRTMEKLKPQNTRIR
jgi:hypothetical protein